MRYIVTCSCSGIKEKAMSAFSFLFPDEELPEMFVGKDNIRKLRDSIPDTNFARYLDAIAKKNGQYSYYFEVSDSGDILDNINLMTGKKNQ